jgi:hypothetical protein
MLTLVTLFLPIVAAFAPTDASPRARQLCSRILHMQPAANPAWACQFADTLDREARKHAQDPYLSLAIAMQESSLKPLAVGPTGDRGIFQIHPGTAKRLGIDLHRLDGSSYSIRQHLRILRLKRQLPGCQGKRWWSCYHSTTPHLRAKYERAVLRWLPAGAHP